MKKYSYLLPYIIFLIALFSSLASLYFSEILHFTPCMLCWYQRIAMYPIVPMTVVGILLRDKHLPLYILPLATFGWLIGLYQNLLYYKVIAEPIIPCQNGISCTTKFVQMFGFIDIPLGSFIAFTFILICTIILLKLKHNFHE